jgi:hypothetical protein
MFKGRRFTEFALGGLALLVAFSIGGYILGFSLGEQAGEQEANTNAYARHAQDEIDSACAGLNGVAQTECIVRVVEATNEHQRSEQDLNAQKEMARWALAMLIVTALMAFVTALGVYYIWRTLLATQRMARDTGRIGEAQVRAHMCPSQFYAVKAVGEERDDLIVVWKNMGATPATIIGYGEAKKVIRAQSAPDFGGNSSGVSVHTIPKGGAYHHTIKLPREARASGFNADERSLVWIASCIVYQDIFGRTFIHYCKGYIEPPQWRGDPIGVTQNRMYHFAEVDGLRVENTIKLHGKYGDWIVSENPDYSPQDMEFISIDFGLRNAKPISGDPN